MVYIYNSVYIYTDRGKYMIGLCDMDGEYKKNFVKLVHVAGKYIRLVKTPTQSKKVTIFLSLSLISLSLNLLRILFM